MAPLWSALVLGQIRNYALTRLALWLSKRGNRRRAWGWGMTQVLLSPNHLGPRPGAVGHVDRPGDRAGRAVGGAQVVDAFERHPARSSSVSWISRGRETGGAQDGAGGIAASVPSWRVVLTFRRGRAASGSASAGRRAARTASNVQVERLR
jgi:hypothetical protein